MKTGGGNAGHNGLRSITAHLGNDYRRLRLGIGHPGDKALVHGFVLNDFGRGERAWVEALCDAVADNVGLLAKRQDASLQNRVHLRMEAAGFGDVGLPGVGRPPPLGGGDAAGKALLRAAPLAPRPRRVTWADEIAAGRTTWTGWRSRA